MVVCGARIKEDQDVEYFVHKIDIKASDALFKFIHIFNKLPFKVRYEIEDALCKLTVKTEKQDWITAKIDIPCEQYLYRYNLELHARGIHFDRMLTQPQFCLVRNDQISVLPMLDVQLCSQHEMFLKPLRDILKREEDPEGITEQAFKLFDRWYGAFLKTVRDSLKENPIAQEMFNSVVSLVEEWSKLKSE